MKWTNEQKNAIFKKDNNILVAAAAGSGKTAVLVERIINKILNEKIDIDKLLVVTFTNAAASEMRERVLDAIYKKLDENPNDENLQKQIVLLGKSNICTIHSFCLDVIRNNFFELNLSANFRIASEQEIELLKQEVLEDFFEELYESENDEFIKLVECYTGYKGDESLKNIIFYIDKIIQSMPFPKEWLEEKVSMFDKTKNTEKYFSKTIWGEILLKYLKEGILDIIHNLQIQKNKLEINNELVKYAQTIGDDIILLKGLLDSCISWDMAYEYTLNLKFKTWPSDKKIVSDLKDNAKKVRDNEKKKLESYLNKTLIYNSEEAFNDIYLLYDNIVTLKNLVLNFEERFKKQKLKKNIIDFSDIEHYALELLLKKGENENLVPTEIAKMYSEKFEEIAIDEYQDSNQIQELILKSISRGNNIFMVGDVKQSIYKFRQACPELFLNKYNTYSLDGNKAGLKIKLFKNFRSNENILNITNTIFESIMSKELGDIDYTKDEYLNLGADYPLIENNLGKSEWHILNIKDKEQEIPGEETFEKENDINLIEQEAIFVSQKINELIKSEKLIKQKDGTYRKIDYRDIVILLRSTKSIAPIFERILSKNDIPVFSDTASEYFDTMEVQIIMNVLKILDNPLDDINLVSVMRSPIGNFTDNEILEIRLQNREDSVYSNLINANESNEFVFGEKIKRFLNLLNKWKEESEYLSLAELIWTIYTDTGFLNFVGLMPNGVLRQANLKMLFERAKEYEKTSFSGLFNFIRFVEKLKTGNSDMSSAKVIGENENVVRIMSIHKSKGLEFPVVFLSYTSKSINMQETKETILLHKDVGFGPEYIDYERRIRYSTAAKQAIKIIATDEAISEEMRILYVALTRAKEKLIITGSCKDFQKEDENKKEILESYKDSENKINPILIKKYSSYFDWIHLVYLNSELSEYIERQIHCIDEIKDLEIITEKSRDLDFEKNIDFEKIKNMFAWDYSDKELIKLPIKTTVSQIKQLEKQDNIGLEEITTQFEEHRNVITATRKGTIIHLILQKLNFTKVYTEKDLKDVVNQLVQKNIIKKEEENIGIQEIKNFLESEFYARIRESKIIEKEKTFCIDIELEEYNNEKVAVQGIIDLYFIDKNDKLVLVDYKTDFVKDEEILKERYLRQLEIYKKALELSLNKKVDEMYIYSMFKNKVIY